MNVIWFSGRQINDLCATTQKSLAAGLIKKGHNVKFVNPDIVGIPFEISLKCLDKYRKTTRRDKIRQKRALDRNYAR